MPSAVSTMVAGSVEPITVYVRVGDGADGAVRSKFAQAIDRIGNVDVALKSDPIEVDGYVAHQDVSGR